MPQAVHHRRTPVVAVLGPGGATAPLRAAAAAGGGSLLLLLAVPWGAAPLLPPHRRRRRRRSVHAPVAAAMSPSILALFLCRLAFHSSKKPVVAFDLNPVYHFTSLCGDLICTVMELLIPVKKV